MSLEVEIPTQLSRLHSTLRSPLSIDHYLSDDKPLILPHQSQEIAITKTPVGFRLVGVHGESLLSPAQAVLLATVGHNHVMPIYQLTRFDAELHSKHLYSVTNRSNQLVKKITQTQEDYLHAPNPGGFIRLVDISDEEFRVRSSRFVKSVTEFIDAAIGNQIIDQRLLLRLQSESGQYTVYRQALLSAYNLYRSYFKADTTTDGIFMPLSPGEEKTLALMLKQRGYTDSLDAIVKITPLLGAMPFLKMIEQESHKYFLLPGVNDSFLSSSQRFEEEIIRAPSTVSVKTPNFTFTMLEDSPDSPSQLSRLYFKPTHGETFGIDLSKDEAALAFFIIKKGGFAPFPVFTSEMEGNPKRHILKQLNHRVQDRLGQSLVVTLKGEGIGIVGANLDVARDMRYYEAFTKIKNSKLYPAPVSIGFNNRLISFVPENLSLAEGLRKPYLVIETPGMHPIIIRLTSDAGLLHRELIRLQGKITPGQKSAELVWDRLSSCAERYNQLLSAAGGPKLYIRQNSIEWQDPDGITNLETAQELLAKFEVLIPEIPDWMSPVKNVYINFHDIYSQLPQISIQEERQLLYLAQNGNETATKIILQRNVRAIKYIAREFEYLNIPVEELIQAGWIALYKGIKDYKFNLNVRVAVYLKRSIRQDMIDVIRREYRKIIIPGDLEAKIARYKRVTNGSNLSLSNSEQHKELARQMQMTVQELMNFADRYRFVLDEVSLDELLQTSSGNEGDALLDMIPGSNNIGESVDNNDLVRFILSQLDADDVEIFLTRYFADGSERHSLEEVANILNISLSSAKTRLYRIREKMKANPVILGLRGDITGT